MARTYITYPDTIYGHMLAAITARYVRKTKPNERIIYWPSVIDNAHRDSTEMCVPTRLGRRDSVYFAGETPSATGMLKIFEAMQPKYVAWYAFIKDSVIRLRDAKILQGYDVDAFPGIRTDKPELGVRMWKEFFPDETVPPCVKWVDDYYQGHAGTSAKAFVHGLRLLETCPRRLEKNPDFLTEEEGNDGSVPDNVWDACFSVYSPADFDAEGFDAEQELNRMTWDATYQIMNMGSIVDTLVRLNTQEAIEHDLFRHMVLPDETLCLLVNSRECDPDVIREMYNKAGATAPYAGWYYVDCTYKPKFHVSLVKLSTGESCIDVAKKFDNSAGSDDFATFTCSYLGYRDKRAFWKNMFKDPEDAIRSSDLNLDDESDYDYD